MKLSCGSTLTFLDPTIYLLQLPFSMNLSFILIGLHSAIKAELEEKHNIEFYSSGSIDEETHLSPFGLMFE